MHYTDASSSEFDIFDKVELTPATLKKPSSNTASVVIPQALRDYKPDAYRIGIHDVVHVSVWSNAQMMFAGNNDASVSANAGKLVDNNGNIFIPVAGAVKIADLSVAEARDAIMAKLARYIESPQVDIKVAEYASQSFSVTGQVQTPSKIALTAKPVTILEAIDQAGGFLDSASLHNIRLVRSGVSYQLDIKSLMLAEDASIFNLFIKTGDVIQVSDNRDNRVFVVGEVNNPQPVELNRSNISLTAALGEVGGVNPLYADGDSIFVIRLVTGDEGVTPTLYHLKGDSPVAFMIADRFQLQPRDVVFVGTSAITRWNRVISQLLPSFNFAQSASSAL